MVEEEQSVDSTSMSPPEQLGASGQITMDGNSLARSNSKGSVTGVNLSGHAPFPPPKTDKPRPHVCTTCMRSFARLEHLKRHERSHTKEKPFECPECTRCFARRDLLLRHQQKLHSTTTPSSRPRSGRRESTAGVASGRVRKNSVANNAATTRPRANTLSHVDTGTLGVLTNNSPNQILGRNYAAGHSHHNSFSGMSGGLGYQYRGISTGHHASMSGLPRLETGLSVDLSGGLRTAPPFGGFGAEMGMNAFAFSSANASTINPHALHLHGMQGVGLEGSASPFQHFFGAVSGHQNMNDEENNFDWMAHGFESQMSFAQAHENAIDDSSPSAMSTNSPTGVSELMLDGGPIVMQNLPSVLTPNWQQKMPNQIQMVNSPANMDFSSSTFNEMMHVPTGTMSPKSQLTQNGLGLDMNFSTPPDSSAIDPASMVPDFSGPPFHLPFNRPGGASTASTTSVDSSLRQSSITTASSELVNDHTRNYLLAGLTQNAGFGQHKFSQPSVSSPLSPTSGTRSSGFNINNFPSLPDLQRYVSAYIQYFHPHLPFLHIVSLNFESLDYTTPLRSMPNHMQFGQAAIAGGGSCLVLSIAAIGALFEHDVSVSRDLFEYAKRFISSFLEERRKANLSKTQYGAAQHSELEDTPLWLVQAMLLNVIYGHNCGDKTAAENASNHCAALVSLARGAELTRPPVSPNFMYTNDIGNGLVNASLHMNGMTSSGWNSMIVEPDDSDWRAWRVMEERKRTLYAVFILSSMLVTAYNHAPALTNSEIRLDLPCDEELWSADNAGAWRAMGGSAIAESKSVAFSAALGHLLTAAQREQRRQNSAPHSESGVADIIASQLKPSTFGCLVLINALHNYIWETRQRHLGRQWTTPETEQMHAHIEPALRAWQAAWASNPCHSIERPNPFGAGPLSADSIPLLDLAYVRLFYNLGRAKEAFWQRDYDAMAEELGKNPDFVNVAETQQRMKKEMPPPNRRSSQSPQNLGGEPNLEAMDQGVKQQEPDDPPISAVPTTQRERYLRKAAQYAADHLSTADELGLSFADQTCKELPSQSAMCVFDCAQVLAEWVTTLQERVGKYIGIIGQDEMDLQQVPGVLLLEDVDRQLLEKIDLIAQSAWHKLGNEAAVPLSIDGGYASKILMLTAHMLERAAVWPVTKLMARSLETHARHMKGRVLASVGMAT